MQRFIVKRHVPLKHPSGGTIMLPEGYIIGPGTRSVSNTKLGHFGKPDNYWKKHNVVKAKREKQVV